MGEKLVCDKCGAEYTDTESIETAKRFAENWAAVCVTDEVEPRGLCPCPHTECPGELILKTE